MGSTGTYCMGSAIPRFLPPPKSSRTSGRRRRRSGVKVYRSAHGSVPSPAEPSIFKFVRKIAIPNQRMFPRWIVGQSRRHEGLGPHLLGIAGAVVQNQFVKKRERSAQCDRFSERDQPAPYGSAPHLAGESKRKNPSPGYTRPHPREAPDPAEHSRRGCARHTREMARFKNDGSDSSAWRISAYPAAS